ncbi:hypothetical protein G6F40_016069 [Rhizopus arrhizus]|nr:hypothetical protein G6F40_016069 [Rhizopus arrhizus]
MPARLRIAIHLRDQALPVFEAFADLRVQAAGGVQPPARAPLRPPHTTRLASSTTARTPKSRAKVSAADRPVKPDPTITMSASTSPWMGPSSSGGSPALATQYVGA